MEKVARKNRFLLSAIFHRIEQCLDRDRGMVNTDSISLSETWQEPDHISSANDRLKDSKNFIIL